MIKESCGEQVTWWKKLYFNVRCENHDIFLLTFKATDTISKTGLEIWTVGSLNLRQSLFLWYKYDYHTTMSTHSEHTVHKNADTAFRFWCKTVLSSLTPSVVPELKTPHSCLDCHTRPQISCQAVCASPVQVPRSRSAGRKCQSSTETVTTAERSSVKPVCAVQSHAQQSTHYTMTGIVHAEEDGASPEDFTRISNHNPKHSWYLKYRWNAIDRWKVCSFIQL